MQLEFIMSELCNIKITLLKNFCNLFHKQKTSYKKSYKDIIIIEKKSLITKLSKIDT